MTEGLLEKFKGPVRGDIIAEINKRGLSSSMKDETGKVVKKRNVKGPNSMFGWGTVDATPPVLRKDLTYIKNNFLSIIREAVPKKNEEERGEEEEDGPDSDAEIDALFGIEEDENSKGKEDVSYLEKAPDKRQKSNYNAEVAFDRVIEQQVVTSGSKVASKSSLPPTHVPPLIDQWYQTWAQDHDNGNIGLVPEGYTGVDRPPLQAILSSQTGKVLLHFSRFIKTRF